MLQSSRAGFCVCSRHVFAAKQLTKRRQLLHTDSRQRLTSWWTPTGGVSSAPKDAESGYSLLVRAGLLRQAYSGLFHLLPLGLRIQDKLEALVDKHMKSIGASKLALSTISSQSTWQRSGRYIKAKEQLFSFEDRRRSKYILSPTHEEEITSLVSGMVQSPKDLPLRLYQITRKYRDEPRARGGLLRSREFLMKDLYTFDQTVEQALAAYDVVKDAYHALFSDLNLSVLVAAADSGDMGGNLSHEFHMPSQLGEDTIVSCGTCDYVANEEVVLSSKPLIDSQGSVGRRGTSTWVGVSVDRDSLIVAYFPSTNGSSAVTEINTHAIKRVFPALDTSVEKPIDLWTTSLEKKSENAGSRERRRIVRLFDYRIDLSDFTEDKTPVASVDTTNIPLESFWTTNGHTLDLLRPSSGSKCPKCSSGTVEVQKAVEIGHVFYLGTRYSKVFRALTDEKPASGPTTTPLKKVPLEMGCHGIGISRLIGTIADRMCDSKGLNWPRAIAPFEVVIIAGKDHEGDAESVYDALLEGSPESSLKVDTVIDDRPRELVWKMKDADLLGIPVLIILGRSWQKDQSIEVQCRRSGKSAQFVPLSELKQTVSALLNDL